MSFFTITPLYLDRFLRSAALLTAATTPIHASFRAHYVVTLAERFSIFLRRDALDRYSIGDASAMLQSKYRSAIKSG